MRRVRRQGGVVIALALAASSCAVGPGQPPAEVTKSLARGVVFHDRNGDGVRSRGEEGVGGVAVSNGRDVVRTDRQGRYALAIGDDAILFVVKPRGYATPLGPEGVPHFSYVHKPAGSPPLSFPGVAPTGPLPSSVDFPLYRVDEPERFRALILGDPQPYTLEELDFLARDLIEPLMGSDAAFSLVLGDLVGDDLSLFEPLSGVLSQLGFPWYPVHGNHDMNYDARDDAHADETWERVFGPATYAFQVGRAHFVILDDVLYHGWDLERERPGSYEGALRDDQLAFLRGYLAGVPTDDLVVLAMHIPLGRTPPFEVKRRRELLEILSSHPHTLSLSAHTHYQAQEYFGPEDGYAPGDHLHWIQGAAAGSWWRGALDETGIPHTTMRDGTPNGYAILHVDGTDAHLELRAARRPASYQMNIVAPDVVSVAEAPASEVLVNVFAGSERTRVEMRLDGGAWLPLERTLRPDPHYAVLVERERELPDHRGKRLPPPIDSPHLWRGWLPSGLAPGIRAIQVRAVDSAGLDARAWRLIRIEPSARGTRREPAR